MRKDSLGDRMKSYEAVTQTKLMRRQPVIIRIDGKAFHTFTKGMKRPFDKVMCDTMKATTKYLCENVQGCVLGYTQSDEITLLLKDWQTFDTSAWFDNKVQKIASVSASMATMAFNKEYYSFVEKMRIADSLSKDDYEMYSKKYFKAMFDSRVFSLSKEEVTNCFVWRQQDAVRNSIQSLAQSLFSHKEIHGITCNDLQNKMLLEKDVNWNNVETQNKRGTCVRKSLEKWVVDTEIPIFSENRDYIDDLLD